jgi:hypothetical protein
MRQQFIITIILTLILSIAIPLKLIYFPRNHGHTAFYFYSTFWICGILITIICLNMLWNIITSKKSGNSHRPYAFWPNRRETFRIIYPAFIQPTLIVEEVDGIKKRQLEFPIVDLSQEGSCFIDDGCLSNMRTFSGLIRFNNGETIRVSGELVRRKGDYVSVQFSHSIGWSILLEEQRRLLVNMKLKPRHLS